VLFDEGFASWLDTISEGLRRKILGHVELLERFGPNLGRPKVDTVRDSNYPNMKEPRIQYKGDPWRVLFAFDPERRAILLIGGNKATSKRWMTEAISIADERFSRHLESL
jgi:hypothetical protein